MKSLKYLTYTAITSIFIAGCGLSEQPASTETGAPEASSNEVENSTSSESVQQVAGETAQERLPYVRSYLITAKQFEFRISPTPFRATVGDTVTLSLTSVDVPHGFSIPEYNINISLEPNDIKTMSFTADKPGIFEVQCSVYCGDGHGGMKTTFEVLE